MKKLMTLIGAVAMAFGLHADPLLTGVGFDTLEADTALDTSGDYWTAWTAAEGEALTVKGWEAAGEVYTAECGRPTLPEGDGGSLNFLNVKTAFANPVYRNINTDGGAQAIGTGLYFDQLVKFTACDEDPTEEYADGKLVVYTKEIVDANDEVTDTRLCVKAGKYNGSELGSAVYDCGSIQDGWHRVTIKAIDSVYNSVNAGFALYIDGAPKAYTEGNAGYDTSKLSAVGKALNTAKKLFPSLVGGVSVLTGVGFAGQGMVDDIALTDQAPAFAQDAYFTINWDEHVASLSYTVEGVTTPADVTLGTAGSVPLLYTGAMDVEVAVTYAENWGKGEWIGDTGVTVDGTTFKVAAGNTTGTVVSEDATPRLAVTIGEGAAVTYPSFAKALEAINAQAEDATIVLNQNIDLGTILDDGGYHTEAMITSEGAVTIDLNGKTITGPETIAEYVIMSAAALTIIDSSKDGTGTVVPSAENIGAVYVSGAKLIVTGGTFMGGTDDENGTVVVDNGESEIFGGKFQKGENESSFALTHAEGCYVDQKDIDDYTWWVVAPAPKATVAFSAPHAEIAGVEAGDEVAADKVLTFTVEPKSGYELAEENAVVVNGMTLTDDEGTYTYTVTAADVTAGTVTITVNTTAIEYTITYTDDDQFFEYDSYTVENYTEKVLWDGDRSDEGLEFDGTWTDETGNDVTDLAAYLADLVAEDPTDVVFSGSWTAVEPQEDWPAEWASIEADDAVKAKFKAWSEGVGKGANLATDAAKNAFLLNVAPADVKEIKIESIDVDAEGNATIVVAAPGEYGFAGVDLGAINGVLYVEAGDTLESMAPKAISYWTTTSGKANITVKYNFIKVAIGFAKPKDLATQPPKPE